MKIIVAGSDQRTLLLVKALTDARHHVTLVSNSKHFCILVANQLDRTTVFGDASQTDILADAGAKHCQLLIAMTEDDADNLVICELAKKRFGIARTIAIVENPVNSTVFSKAGCRLGYLCFRDFFTFGGMCSSSVFTSSRLLITMEVLAHVAYN